MTEYSVTTQIEAIKIMDLILKFIYTKIVHGYIKYLLKSKL